MRQPGSIEALQLEGDLMMDFVTLTQRREFLQSKAFVSWFWVAILA